MITPKDQEIQMLVALLSHPAGFDIDMGGTLCIRPIDECSPPESWEVDWETRTSFPGMEYKEFSNLQEAVQFFVDKRHELEMGLDFEAEAFAKMRKMSKGNRPMIQQIELKKSVKLQKLFDKIEEMDDRVGEISVIVDRVFERVGAGGDVDGNQLGIDLIRLVNRSLLTGAPIVQIDYDMGVLYFLGDIKELEVFFNEILKECEQVQQSDGRVLDNKIRELEKQLTTLKEQREKMSSQ